MYVGNENNLVVETTNDGFHGSDGFNDAEFSHTPDVGKIKRNEMAHQAILRYTNEYPGLNKYKKILCFLIILIQMSYLILILASILIQNRPNNFGSHWSTNYRCYMYNL